MLEVLVYAMDEGAGGEEGVASKHFGCGCDAVAVGGEFVLLLGFVDGELAYFAFAVTAQGIAYGLKQGADDAVEEVVASHVEVGCFGREAERL